MARRLGQPEPLAIVVGALLVVTGSVGLAALVFGAGLPWEGMAVLILAWVVAITFGTRA